MSNIAIKNNQSLIEIQKIILNEGIQKGILEVSLDLFTKFIDPKMPKEEAEKALIYCAYTGLNPFNKEICFVPFKGNYVAITEMPGYLRMLNAYPNYSWHTMGVITRECDKDNKIVPGTEEVIQDSLYYPENHKIVGAWATIYFKNDRPPWTVKMPLKSMAKAKEWLVDAIYMAPKTVLAHMIRQLIPGLQQSYLREELNENYSPQTLQANIVEEKLEPEAPTATQEENLLTNEDEEDPKELYKQFFESLTKEQQEEAKKMFKDFMTKAGFKDKKELFPSHYTYLLSQLRFKFTGDKNGD